MQYEKKSVWSVLLRLFHWSLVISIIFLVVTGFYIGDPWTNTQQLHTGSFPMADMRYYHFLAGYLFTAAILVRIYLLFFGNKYERVWNFLPITPKNIGNLFRTLLRYLYVSDSHGKKLGHNTLAGIAYLVTIIAGCFQLVAGFFLLYPESGFWQGLGGSIYSSQQDARFIHHLLMWYFIIFAFIHVYIVVWNDVKSPEGLISSIFNGKKFKRITDG